MILTSIIGRRWLRITALVVVCLFSLNTLVWADPDVLLQPALFSWAPGDTGLIETSVAQYLRGIRCPIEEINYHLFPTIDGKRIDIYFDQKQQAGDTWLVPCTVGSKNYEARISPNDLSIEVHETSAAATEVPSLPDAITPELKLFDFVERDGFFHGQASDGSLHVPTPYYVLIAAFSRLRETLGTLDGKTFLDIGCGDLRAGLIASYLDHMIVTAVEKDKDISGKAKPVFDKALAEGFVSADTFSLREGTDALSGEMDWSNVDLALFFYTYPTDPTGKKAFRASIENKVKTMKSDGTMAMIFTHTQIALGHANFPGLDTEWPSPEKIYDKGPGYYLQIYRAPKANIPADFFSLPEEPNTDGLSPAKKIARYTAYIDHLYRTIAKFKTPAVYATDKSGNAVQYSWRDYCDVHGLANPTTVMIMTANMWHPVPKKDAEENYSLIARHYTDLCARLEIMLAFANEDLSQVRLDLPQKGTESDPLQYAGLSEYFLFKIFVDSPDAPQNREIFHEVAKRISAALEKIDRSIRELGKTVIEGVPDADLSDTQEPIPPPALTDPASHKKNFSEDLLENFLQGSSSPEESMADNTANNPVNIAPPTDDDMLEDTLDLSTLPKEPDFPRVSTPIKIANYTHYIDILFGRLARLQAPPVWAEINQKNKKLYTWRSFCDIHGMSTPSSIITMAAGMWEMNGPSKAEQNYIIKSYNDLRTRFGILLSLSRDDVSLVKFRLKEKGTESDPLPYVGLSEYFLFKLFVDNKNAARNRELFYEVTKRISSAIAILDSSVKELSEMAIDEPGTLSITANTIKTLSAISDEIGLSGKVPRNGLDLILFCASHYGYRHPNELKEFLTTTSSPISPSDRQHIVNILMLLAACELEPAIAREYGRTVAATTSTFGDEAISHELRHYIGALRSTVDYVDEYCDNSPELRPATEQLRTQTQTALFACQIISEFDLKDHPAVLSHVTDMLTVTIQDSLPVLDRYLTSLGQTAHEAEELAQKLREELAPLDKIAGLLSNVRKSMLEPDKKVTYNLNELVRQSAEVALGTNVRNSRLKLSLSMDDNIPEAFLYPDAWFLWTNLLSNAKDAVKDRKDGEISITTNFDKKNSEFIVTIEDNGIGIPEELLGKIWEKGFTTKEQGTGSGLALVKEVLEHNGGKIFVMSKEGNGTLFTVRLPLAAQAEELKEKLPPAGSPWYIDHLLRTEFAGRAMSAEDLRLRTIGKMPDGHLSTETVKRDLGTLAYLGVALPTGDNGKEPYRSADLSPPEWTIVEPALKALGNRPSADKKETARAEIETRTTLTPQRTPGTSGTPATPWWQRTEKTYIAMSLPIYGLRREMNDPGIGKFTDLGRYYRDVLSRQGIDVILLLPHFAIQASRDESPYAPVCLFAVNELFIDWAQVKEVTGNMALLGSTVAPPGSDIAVDYKNVEKREFGVALAAWELFRKNELGKGTSRAKNFERFVSMNSDWLDDYAEYMALHRIINKPPAEWTDADRAKAKSNPSYPRLVNTHKYAQWIGYMQFTGAVAQIHENGGKVLFDLPMFRGKDSLDVWKHPQYFKQGNPGIIRPGLNENWTDLRLWNWQALKNEGYEYMLAPVRHWLDMGLDGTRMDALHFAYNFGSGQLASGDEPGADYVRALAEIFKAREAFPLAEAYEGKYTEIHSFGIEVTNDNWKQISYHDDPRQFGMAAAEDFINAVKTLASPSIGSSGTSSRFVSFTFGDEWGEPFPVKEHVGNECTFHYRMPVRTDKDWHNRVRFDASSSLAAQKILRDKKNLWEHADSVKLILRNTAADFVKKDNGRTAIWASSTDWFQQEWGRDTFIALPGLLLSTGRYAEAKNNLDNFAHFMRDGLIPNRIWDPQNRDTIEYNTADASLWFIHAVKKYMDHSGDKEFARSMLPVMRSIMASYISGTGYHRHGRFNRIYMDTDGLIVSPAQATWMDADPDGKDRPVTPRNGKAVEINALWYTALGVMSDLEEKMGDRQNAVLYRDTMARTRRSFNEKFWNAQESALYDVIEGDPHKGAIRPNMLLAVSLSDDLLSPERQAGVVDSAAKDLLTPYGLRTLSPRDSNYRGKYETWKPPSEKDLAYHQGTVWPWLIGPYVDALARVRRHEARTEDEIREEIRKVIAPLLEHLVENPYYSLPEVFDGSAPHTPGGTRSQAWSVAEILRVISEYRLFDKGPRITFPETFSGEALPDGDVLELILRARKEWTAYGTCREHSLELAGLLFARGMDVVIKKRSIGPYAVHFWVEEPGPYGRIMDAFPEGMGENGTGAALTIRDERYIITKKDSSLTAALYDGGEVDKNMTAQARKAAKAGSQGTLIKMPDGSPREIAFLLRGIFNGQSVSTESLRLRTTGDMPDGHLSTKTVDRDIDTLASFNLIAEKTAPDGTELYSLIDLSPDEWEAISPILAALGDRPLRVMKDMARVKIAKTIPRLTPKDPVPAYENVIGNTLRLAKIGAVISDFDGVDRDHSAEIVPDGTISAKRMLSERNVRNITITGSETDLFIKRYGGTERIAEQYAGTPYTALTYSGAMGYSIDGNGDIRAVDGFKTSSLGAGKAVETATAVARTILAKVAEEAGIEASAVSQIRIGGSEHGVTIYAESNKWVHDMRFRIAELIRQEIRELPKGTFPDTTDVVTSFNAVDIIATSKGASAIQLIKLFHLTSVVLIADSVGTEEDPGNDRSMLAITAEDLRKADIDWPVDLIKIYVGREKNAEIPAGAVVAPQGKTETEPARNIYNAIIHAKDSASRTISVLRNDAEPKYMSNLPVVYASELSEAQRAMAIESLAKWLTYRQPEAVHKADMREYITDLRHNDRAALSKFCLVLSEDAHEVEGWVDFEVVEDISMMEIAPWNRKPSAGERKYKGVGAGLRAFAIRELIKSFGNDIYKEENISRLIALGHMGTDSDASDIFDDRTIDKRIVEKYLRDQDDIQAANIKKYGFKDAPTGASGMLHDTKGPGQKSPPDKTAKRMSEAQAPSTLRDLSSAQETALNLKETLLSLASTKKLVLAFDKDIAAFHNGDPLGVFAILVELKKDDRYKTILSNIEVISASAEELPSAVGRYFAQKDTEVFIFAREDARAGLRPLESSAHSTYINEKDLPISSYYPLPEVVVLALSRYFYDYLPTGETNTAIHTGKTSIVLRTLNIDSIKAEDNVLIFKLLPDAEPCETKDLIKRCAELKRFLKSA